MSCLPRIQNAPRFHVYKVNSKVYDLKTVQKSRFGNLINFLAPAEYGIQRDGEMIGASAVADVIIEGGEVKHWATVSGSKTGLRSVLSLFLGVSRPLSARFLAYEPRQPAAGVPASGCGCGTAEPAGLQTGH